MRIAAFIFAFFLFSGCNGDNSKKYESKQSINKQRPYPLKEKVFGGYVKFPAQMFGINFCTYKLSTVIYLLERNNSTYVMYNGDGEEIHNKNNSILGVLSKSFIGKGFDDSKIIDVNYKLSSPSDHNSDRITVEIKFLADYYDELLKIMKNKYPMSKASINILGYDEISWYAHPDLSIPTCIDEITLSHKLRYGNDGSDEFCYLTICTRGKNPHVH